MKQRIGLGLLLTWVAVCCLVGSSEAAKFKYENLGTLGGTNNYMPSMDFLIKGGRH